MQQPLGLPPPWTVVGAHFDAEAHRLDIDIDFAPGGGFACPTCGAADCPAYDSERMTWRHLNFFQHQAPPNARVPRVRCETCGRDGGDGKSAMRLRQIEERTLSCDAASHDET